jgi:hypothetical protein
MRTSRLFAILATGSTGLALAIAGPAEAAVKITSGLATVTQAPTVSTPGFNTTCTVAKKTQNCAEIRTQTAAGSYMALGGSFQQVLDASTGKALVDPATGVAIALNNLVLLDTTNNNAVVTTFKHKFNGEVLATAVSADQTKLYAGGEFTTVDGKAIQHLVAFSLVPGAGFGTILPAFTVGGKATINPAVKNTAYSKRGRVRTLLAGPSLPGGGSAGTLYVGGDFNSALGSGAQQLAAIDIATGKLITGFTPNISVATTLPYCGNWLPVTAANNSTQIWSLALSNDGSTNRLYVSGHFDTVDGAAQTALAAVNPATGRYDASFKPVLSYMTSAMNPNDGKVEQCYDILHTGNQVTAVDSAGGTRAAGVLLAQAGHYNCSYHFKLDGTRPAGGGWVARPGGDSQSIVIANKTVYVGGHFICWSADQAIGLGRPDCLADMAAGTVPRSYDISRVHLAALDYDTGALDMSWAPSAQPSTYSPYYFGVWTLLVDSKGQLWAGGAFRTVNSPDGTSYSRNKLAVFPVLTAAAAPSASFSPIACKVATSCKLTAYGDPAPGSTISSYAWNFGDGGTATGQSVAHTFAKSGPATVTVTVTDSKGRTGIAKYVVRVVAAA